MRALAFLGAFVALWSWSLSHRERSSRRTIWSSATAASWAARSRGTERLAVRGDAIARIAFQIDGAAHAPRCSRACGRTRLIDIHSHARGGILRYDARITPPRCDEYHRGPTGRAHSHKAFSKSRCRARHRDFGTFIGQDRSASR